MTGDSSIRDRLEGSARRTFLFPYRLLTTQIGIATVVFHAVFLNNEFYKSEQIKFERNQFEAQIGYVLSPKPNENKLKQNIPTSLPHAFVSAVANENRPNMFFTRQTVSVADVQRRQRYDALLIVADSKLLGDRECVLLGIPTLEIKHFDAGTWIFDSFACKKHDEIPRAWVNLKPLFAFSTVVIVNVHTADLLLANSWKNNVYQLLTNDANKIVTSVAGESEKFQEKSLSELLPSGVGQSEITPARVKILVFFLMLAMGCLIAATTKDLLKTEIGLTRLFGYSVARQLIRIFGDVLFLNLTTTVGSLLLVLLAFSVGQGQYQLYGDAILFLTISSIGLACGISLLTYLLYLRFKSMPIYRLVNVGRL
jgi:hypothetical protein